MSSWLNYNPKLWTVSKWAFSFIWQAHHEVVKNLFPLHTFRPNDYTTVNDSEQSWEGEQMLLSTEGIQRAGQSKTAQYVASNRKQIKKIPWQIKRINYFLIWLEMNLIWEKIWWEAPGKPQISPIEPLNQFQSQLRALES